MADTENRMIDWDDEITDDGEYSGEETAILPEDNYPFEVIKVEKAFFDGSDKIPPCNMAKVYLRIDGGELGKGLCVEQIFLLEKMEWKAASFLRSIGLKKHGEPIAWRQLTHCDGETGRCRVIVDEYKKNGEIRKSNKVKNFFDKEEAKAKKEFKKGAF